MNILQIIEQIQLNNNESFALLMEEYKGLLYKASSQHHVMAIQQEAYSEACFRFYQAVLTFDSSLGIPFAGYVKYKVYAGVHTLFRRYLRIWRNEISSSAKSGNGYDNDNEETYEDLFDSIADIAEDSALLMDFDKALQVLPEKQRLVAIEIIVKGCTMTETAKNLQVSVQAVSKCYAKAVASIRSNMNFSDDVICANTQQEEKTKSKQKRLNNRVRKK